MRRRLKKHVTAATLEKRSLMIVDGPQPPRRHVWVTGTIVETEEEQREGAQWCAESDDLLPPVPTHLLAGETHSGWSWYGSASHLAASCMWCLAQT